MFVHAHGGQSQGTCGGRMLAVCVWTRVCRYILCVGLSLCANVQTNKKENMSVSKVI